MRTEPLTPNEAEEQYVPNVVIEAINELIIKNYDGASRRTFNISLHDIIEQTLELDDSFDKTIMNSRRCSNIEALFRAYGWGVKLSPADADFIASFTFSGKTKK